MPSAFQMATTLQRYVPRRWLAGVANLVMAAKGDQRRFAVDAAGHWVNAQPQGSFVGPDLHTAHYAQIEARVSAYWFHFYRPKAGDIVIDVGAGIGEDAVILSQLVGASGKVHAIEAHPGIYRCLTATIEQSRLANVVPYQLAIMESDGSVCITDDSEHLGNSIVANGAGIEVEGWSLDHFIASTGEAKIDFLKMNIEGAESGALRGLAQQAGKIRHVAISCHDFVARAGGGDHFRTREEVRKRLLELGFVIDQRDGDLLPWEADVLFGKRAGS